MILKIQSINKGKDTYNVVNDLGEQMTVTSYQIIQVMLQGYIFENAKLTKKGFAIQTAKGTRYVQLQKIPRDVAIAMSNKVDADKAQVQAQKQIVQTQAQAQKQIVQTQAQVQAQKQLKARPKVNLAGVKTGATSKSASLTFKGEVFLSDIQLCKKYNRNVDEFRTLYKKGYSIDEALGLRELRTESEILAEKKKLVSMLDNMESTRK